MTGTIENVKNTIIETLSTGEHTILFEKKDGSLREMRCTRQVDLLPEDRRPKTNRVNAGPSIPVFDLEKGEWRAFTLTNLRSIDDEDYTSTIQKAVEEEESKKD